MATARYLAEPAIDRVAGKTVEGVVARKAKNSIGNSRAKSTVSRHGSGNHGHFTLLRQCQPAGLFSGGVAPALGSC
jgi:hypothetical protein